MTSLLHLTRERQSVMQDVRAARSTFFATVDGLLIKVNKGDLVRVDHPVYEQYEQFFRPVRVRFETAVNGPDELRSLDLSHMPEVVAVSADLPLAELQSIAHREGLATYGRKDEIADRINKKRGV